MMAEFPLDPQLAKMLLYSPQLKYRLPAATRAAWAHAVADGSIAFAKFHAPRREFRLFFSVVPMKYFP